MVGHALIPKSGWQRPANLCEFESNLVYNVDARTARIVTQIAPLSESSTHTHQNNNNKKPGVGHCDLRMLS